MLEPDGLAVPKTAGEAPQSSVLSMPGSYVGRAVRGHRDRQRRSARLPLETYALTWEQTLDKAKTVALGYGPPVSGALAILSVGWIGAKIVRSIIKCLLKRAKLDPTLAGFVGNTVYMLLLAFVLVSALKRRQVSTGPTPFPQTDVHVHQVA